MTVAPAEPDRREDGGDPVSSWFASRLGGILVPIAATALAFLIGGLVVLVTGSNPITAYKAIFEGTGLNWFFPWVAGEAREDAANDLQQTLILMTPLVLTGIAVAFAYRCGLFNIGGQGQYWVGFIAALYVGTHLEGTPRPLHILLAIIASIVAGGVWGGIAGLLKATVGAHEVITTIMLNWIAIFGGQYLFEIGGRLQGPEPSIPRSDSVLDSARLWPIWGSLPALHAGLFIALFALVIYYVLLNRTTLGYEVRAVGFNPEAARYGGISVSKNYFLALAISGAFAGLAGSVDVLGFKFGVSTGDFATNLIAFTGIAVALLGRNKAVGILFAALLFAALQIGTSTRQLDPEVFEPALAVDLATMIQALVIFFVGAEFLILYAWRARRFLGPQPRIAPELER
ncbi:MAG: ABC transporter permease [Actinomycetota bacterium]|nr:ABC transporter permease [Actinomycetota bacterium]